MDEQTFLSLIETHQGLIHRICRIYRQTPEDREDLFQEIVFQLWKSVPGFREEARFSTWMHRIALSTVISAFRKRSPAIRYMAELPEASDAAPADDAMREALFEAIATLGPEESSYIA